MNELHIRVWLQQGLGIPGTDLMPGVCVQALNEHWQGSRAIAELCPFAWSGTSVQSPGYEHTNHGVQLGRVLHQLRKVCCKHP